MKIYIAEEKLIYLINLHVEKYGYVYGLFNVINQNIGLSKTYLLLGP